MAIQNPDISLIDQELKSAIVSIDNLGLPFVICGQFASVFKIKIYNNFQAIRCFTRNIGDKANRYKEIDNHLDQYKASVGINCLTKYEYNPHGIIVGGIKYPILLMEWISGNTLDVYIEQILNQKEALLRLANEWLKITKILHDAKIAHGDLQHGNILIQQNMEIKLVDFDGMYVPRMTTYKACELGHINYQHPKRTFNNFDLILDNFSALVIYVSIRVLTKMPYLWSIFHDEGLIFKKNDFEDPLNSKLFRTILKKSDDDLKRLVSLLKDCCLKSPNEIPFLTDIVQVEISSRLPFWMTTKNIPEVKLKTREAEAEKINQFKPRQETTSAQMPFFPQPIPPLTKTTLPPRYHPKISDVLGTLFSYAIMNIVPFVILISITKLLFASIFIYFVAVILLTISSVKKETRRKNLQRPNIASATSQSAQTWGNLPKSIPTSPTTISPIRTISPRPTPPSYYVGSSIRMIYHKPQCEWALKISRRNKVRFTSRTDAILAHYRACRVCCP